MARVKGILLLMINEGRRKKNEAVVRNGSIRAQQRWTRFCVPVWMRQETHGSLKEF